MLVMTYSEARQNFASILDKSKIDGAVLVKRSDGSMFRISAGIKDVLEKNQPQISYQEAQQVLGKFFSELEQKIAGEAKAAGEAFLAENAKREGVKVTESGLQYEVLEPKPAAPATYHRGYTYTKPGASYVGE